MRCIIYVSVSLQCRIFLFMYSSLFGFFSIFCFLFTCFLFWVYLLGDLLVILFRFVRFVRVHFCMLVIAAVLCCCFFVVWVVVSCCLCYIKTCFFCYVGAFFVLLLLYLHNMLPVFLTF